MFHMEQFASRCELVDFVRSQTGSDDLARAAGLLRDVSDARGPAAQTAREALDSLLKQSTFPYSHRHLMAVYCRRERSHGR